MAMSTSVSIFLLLFGNLFEDRLTCRKGVEGFNKILFF
ncbi:hypothetical protein KIS4809_5311 [Bacillus sp. ZZV12-4809]|nr:hypothetical protein KIS4809_5311 [Bacillus sp. ZZV12-4809]